MTVFGHSVSFNREFTVRRHCVGEDSDAVARHIIPVLKNSSRPCPMMPMRMRLRISRVFGCHRNRICRFQINFLILRMCSVPMPDHDPRCNLTVLRVTCRKQKTPLGRSPSSRACYANSSTIPSRHFFPYTPHGASTLENSVLNRLVAF